MGLLDLYNNGETQFTSLTTDFTTHYSAHDTGKPNVYTNPGPAKPFHQFWTADYTYVDFFSSGDNGIVNGGILKNTLKVTNLDTTSPGVDGGIPYKEDKDPTVYPPTVNHTEPTRGYFAEPGSGPKKFNQTFDANNTYLEFIKSYI